MTPSRVLIDAGPLVAMLSSRDSHHERCIHQSKQLPEVLFTCWPTITEAAHLLHRTSGAVGALLSRIHIGALRILPLSQADAASISAILAKYGDQSFDFADACLMHLAERENIEHVFTLDRRHFSVFRTASDQSLTVLPEG